MVVMKHGSKFPLADMALQTDLLFINIHSLSMSIEFPNPLNKGLYMVGPNT